MKLKPYPKTKPSGVQWLGDVPEHWDVKAIKWETPVFRGASPRPIDDPVYFDDEGEFAWVRIADVTAAGDYLESTTQQLSRLGSSLSVKLNPGALFLSIAGTVGKPCITKIKCCIHDGFVYFPGFRGETKFLFYVFASGEPYRGLGKLGTQLNLNTDSVGSIAMGFPPLSEQIAIAAYLDRETGRIDELVGKKRDLIERLKEKRTALISRTVTRGLPADLPPETLAKLETMAGKKVPLNPPLKPSGIDWLGDVPEHWEVKRLSYLAMLQSGENITSEMIAEGGDYPVFGGNGFRGYYHRFTQKGHFALIGRQGALCGNVNYAKGEFWASEHALVVTPLVDFSVKWMGELLRSMNLGQYSVTAAQPGISAEVIRSLRIPVPPLPEQRAIAAYLDEETAKLNALVAKVETAIERLQEYRTALITAAVTGKIDVRKEVIYA